MKFSIHPLFFVFGLYFALTGKVFLFLTATLTALLHEFGHALAAEKLGYKMNKITLMPYGAVVNGAIGGLSYKDEVSVAGRASCRESAKISVVSASLYTSP